MTREEFLIRLGVETETNQITAEIDAVLDQVRILLNQNNPELNIQIGNTDEVLRQLGNVVTNIQGVSDSVEGLQNITIAFEAANGKVVTLNSNLRNAITELDQLNLTQQQLQTYLNQGLLFDDNGNIAQSLAGARIFDAGNIENTIRDTTTLNSLLREYRNNQREIISLQKKMDDASRVGNQEYSNILYEQIGLLQSRQFEILRNTEAGERLRASEVSTSQENAENDRQQKSYENILKYTSQIEDIRTKMIKSSELEREELQLQIDTLQERIRIEEQIVELSQSEQQRIRETRDVASQVREIEQLKKTITEVNDLYNQMLELTKKINMSPEDSNEVEYYKQKRELINEVIQKKEEEISRSSRSESAQRQLLDIQNKFKENLIQLNAIQQDKDDSARINDAIKKMKELIDAQEKLNKLKSEKAPFSEIEDAVKNVDKLTFELQEATSATLSNGKSVAQSEEYITALNKALEKANDIQSRYTRNAKDGSSILNTVSGSFARVTENVIKYNLAQFGLIENMRRVISTVKELDEAMTNIRIVTGESAESARNTMNSYSELAQQLGATTLQVAEGSLEWMRQGYSVKEAGDLIKSSTMLAKLGMMDEAQASKLLTAAINGYQKSADDAVNIVDKLVKVDLIAATSSEEVATSLQYVASQANAANISLDKMIGLISTTSETTRLSAETIGNAWKSILARMQNVKLGKFLDDDGESLNDTEKILNSFGIALRDTNREWRNMEDVLDEVASKWDSFTSVEKDAIGVAISGTRQRNIFSAAMENYGKVLKYTEESANSAGTAEEKYASYSESLQAHINELISVWQQFVTNMNISGVFNTFIDSASTLISILDILINKFHLLEYVGLPVALIATFNMIGNSVKKLSDKLSSTTSNFKNMTSAMSLLSGKYNEVNAKTAAYQLHLSGLETQQIANVLATKKLTAEQIKQALASTGVTKEVAEAAATHAVNTVAVNTETVATYSLTGALQALKIALLENPIMLLSLIITGIVMVVKGAIDIFNAFNVTIEELEERVQKAKEGFQSITKEIEEVNDALETTKKRIEELENKKIKSLVEKQELADLKDQSRELELQNELLRIQQQIATKELAESQKNLFDEKYKNTPLTQEYYEQVEEGGAVEEGQAGILGVDPNDVISLSFAYNILKEKMQEAVDAGNAFDAEGYSSSLDDIKTTLYNNLSGLQETVDTLNLLTDSGYNLSVEQTELLEQAKYGIELIYKTLSPEKLKQIKLEELIDKGGFDSIQEILSKVKDEFLKGKISADEYKDKIDSIFSEIPEDSELMQKLKEIFSEEDFENIEEFKQVLIDALGVDVPSVVSVAWDDLSNDIEERVNDLKENVGKFGIEIGDLTDFNEATSLYADGLLNIESSYNSLLDAVEEFNSQGFISAQTFKSLSDNNLLQYLTEVDGKLIANTDSLFNNSNSIRENAIQSAKLIALKQIQAIVEEVLNNEGKATEEQTNNTSSAINALLPILNKMAAGEINAATGAELLHKALDGQGISTSSVNKIMEESINVLAGFEATLGNINNLGENFTRITRNGSSASKEFTDSLKEQKEVLKNEKEAIEDLIEAFIKMFKQQLKDQKELIQKQKEAENDRYDQIKKNFDEEEKQQKRLFEDRKDKIEELRDLDNDYYEDRIDALDKELDAYNKKINAQKELLQAKKEEQEYEKDLEEKVKDVAKIQSELAKLQFDDSIEAQKKKIELAEQLAEKQGDLDDFQADHNYELQEDALDKEQQRFEELQNAKKEALEQEKSDWEDYWDERLKSLEKEEKAWKRAFEDRETEAENFHDNEIKRYEEQITAIEDQINNEKQLRIDAIEAIDTANEELYMQLLEWNRTYGTGIDRDIIDKWEVAQGAIEKYNGICNGTQQILEHLAGQLEEISEKSNNMSSGMQRYANSVKDAHDNVLELKKEIQRINKESKDMELSGGMSFKYGGSSSGMYEKSHTGEDYVQPRDDEDRKISKAMGLKSDEVVRILKVGEAVIPKNENLQRLKSNPQMLSQNTVYRTNEISKNSQSYSTDNRSDINISIGDTIIQGNADNNVINKLGEYKKAIVNEVFSKINKHTNLSGFRSVKRYV